MAVSVNRPPQSVAAGTVQGPAPPFLPLPGFMPDAVSFASRLALAMLLAYLVSFTIQLQSASTAGLCVVVVMQPSRGMTVSKAFYRTLGTLVGGIAAFLIGILFLQNRTMLLIAVAGWLAACTFVASLLRDFRAYGAVLSGYTVAVICVGQIDAPADLLLTALDRVAAMLVGVISVALVNTVFVISTAHEHLLAELHRQLDEARATALALLGPGTRPLPEVPLSRAGDLLALRTDAAYASAELADGLRRNHAATAALAALLDMLAASRELGRSLASTTDVSPATRAFLGAMADDMRKGTPPAMPPFPPATPADALIIERAGSLSRDYARARLAVHATETGVMDGLPRHARVHSDSDVQAAVLNAVRAAIATGLGAVLCVLGDDASTSLLLIDLAAFVALLGLQHDPSAAAAAFLPSVPPAAALAGGVAFVLLPLSSGFGVFALSLAPAIFVLGLAARHPATAFYGARLLVSFGLLFSPSNVENYDLSTFLNLLLQLTMACALMMVAFRLILPVSPRRRLVRIADKIASSLRDALRDDEARQGRNGGGHQPSLAYDRLVQALQWAKARRQGPYRVIARLCEFTELDAAACRAMRALEEAADRVPGLRPLARAGQAGLAQATPDKMDAAAHGLLASQDAVLAPDAVLRAVSGLHGAALLMRRQGSALVRYSVIGD